MGPLNGVKIIEIKGIGPGPYAGQLLADLGAELVVVERASKANSIAPPSAFDVNARGKKSIALDLSKAEGVSTLLTLVEQADVIFEGNRPGVAERLGFGPDVCLARNPRIIYGRMTGWGQSGPLADSAGHDYNYISLTGAAAAIGRKESPVPPLNLVGDYAGGSLFLVVGILAALFEANKSGKGQVIDAAITDGSAHLMSVFHTLESLGSWSIERENNVLDGGAPFYAAYQTSDGKHVCVAALEPKFFKLLVAKAGLPPRFVDEQSNPEAWAEMRAVFEATFLSKTRDEWMELFEGTDACVTGILDLSEAPDHPHNRQRGTYVSINGMTQPAPAPRFSRTECAVPDAPSAEGSDTRQVLSGWGFDQRSIDLLEEKGVLS